MLLDEVRRKLGVKAHSRTMIMSSLGDGGLACIRGAIKINLQKNVKNSQLGLTPTPTVDNSDF